MQAYVPPPYTHNLAGEATESTDAAAPSVDSIAPELEADSSSTAR